MNDQDDPFFSSSTDDRTVIRPVPGGRQQDIKRPNESVFAANIEPVSLEKLGKVNPLESAASALLVLISQLYHSPSHSAPQQLKKRLAQEIQTFKINGKSADYDSNTVNDASYSLCTTIDEAIFNTPWGRQSGWGEQSLLSTFHGEVSGGEQFFFKLKEAGQNPSKHLHLLELMYLCLALGFQGRYRIADNGQEKLAQIREWLTQLIRQQRGSTEPLLSPHWQGVVDKKQNLMNAIPLWVFIAIASSLLIALFIGFRFALGADTSPVKAKIATLAIPEIPVAPKPDELATLRKLLSDEIRRDFVDIRDKNGRSLIELRGIKGLFASGSDRVIKQRNQLIRNIADILATEQFSYHSLSVIGHTDNVPIKNPIRFANNFELSEARAKSVAKILISKQPQMKQRLLSEGKADADPIDKADTRDARRKNRRVEIILQ